MRYLLKSNRLSTALSNIASVDDVIAISSVSNLFDKKVNINNANN